MKNTWTAGPLCLVALPLVLLAGCGPAAEGPGASSSSSASGLTVAVNTLPKLGPYVPALDKEIPGLDDNRLKVAPPKGWEVPSRTEQAIIWFKGSPKDDYPQIKVTAGDFETVLNVTQDTADQFAKAIAAELQKSGGAKKTVTPIHIGDFHGASYRGFGKIKTQFKDVDVERLIVETVVDGRKYAFELRSYEGDMEKYSPQLYAVVHGAKFRRGGSGETASTEKPAAKPETKPEEKPETKPEEKPKPETKPEEKPETKPELKPETKPEEKPKPVEKPVAKPVPPKKKGPDVDDEEIK